MSEKGTCWSLTWFPPTDSMNEEVSKSEITEYSLRPLGPGWKLTGQMEKAPDTGRYHFQAMLKTPQVRKSAVIKMMDKAHIELARNSKALEKYVSKDETQVAQIQSADPIPTLFQYQSIIADMWDADEFSELWKRATEKATVPNINDVAMLYVDTLVARDIETGRRGAEFIGINPMWRSSWKIFWKSIIARRDLNSQVEV